MHPSPPIPRASTKSSEAMQELLKHWFLPAELLSIQPAEFESALREMERELESFIQLDPSQLTETHKQTIAEFARMYAMIKLDRGHVHEGTRALDIANRFHTPHQDQPEALFNALTNMLLAEAKKTGDRDRHEQISNILFCMVELTQQPNQYRWGKRLVANIISVLKSFEKEYFNKSDLANLLCGFLENNFKAILGLKKMTPSAQKPRDMSDWEFIHYKVFEQKAWKLALANALPYTPDAHLFTQLPPTVLGKELSQHSILDYVQKLKSGKSTLGSGFRQFLQHCYFRANIDYQSTAIYQNLEIDLKVQATYEIILSVNEEIQRIKLELTAYLNPTELDPALVEQIKLSLSADLEKRCVSLSFQLLNLRAMAEQVQDRHGQLCAKYYLARLAIEESFQSALKDIRILDFISEVAPCIQNGALAGEAKILLEAFSEIVAGVESPEERQRLIQQFYSRLHQTPKSDKEIVPDLLQSGIFGSGRVSTGENKTHELDSCFEVDDFFFGGPQ